jgi:hypothetical protein
MSIASVRIYAEAKQLWEAPVFGLSLLISFAEVLTAIDAATEHGYGGEGPDLDGDEDDFDVAISHPLVDILEGEDELVVLIEVPGAYENVEFGVSEDILILRNEEGREYHEVLLPAGHDLENPTEARFNNGVITMKYQKMPELMP